MELAVLASVGLEGRPDACEDVGQLATTPLGPAVVAESRLPMGTFVTHTRSVAVEHGGHVTYLTVTATTRASAESLLSQMLASLRPA